VAAGNFTSSVPTATEVAELRTVRALNPYRQVFAATHTVVIFRICQKP
jgi:hypothetical protein